METTQQVTDHVADTLSNTKESLERGIHQTSERVQEMAQKVKELGQNTDNETVHKYAEELGDKIQKGAEYVKSQDIDHLTEQLKQQLSNTIRQHPLASIGAALTSGFILARLFSRR
jgi:ElaB/YqjD/DUF883 family membrane-anchored ribosome-binding protein